MNQPVPASDVRRYAIADASIQWAKAPAHIRALAAPYVVPLLAALEAIGAELDQKGGRHGGA